MLSPLCVGVHALPVSVDLTGVEEGGPVSAPQGCRNRALFHRHLMFTKSVQQGQPVRNTRLADQEKKMKAPEQMVTTSRNLLQQNTIVA
jgi:hypothetical protein